MVDKEKILKGLECCKNLDLSEQRCPEECPYLGETQITCGLDPMLDDAIELLKDDETQLIYRDEIIKAHEDEIERLNELLKEQEPQSVIVKCEPSNGNILWFANCPKCGQGIERDKHKNHCGYCGQAVKWDG